ncbi:DNA gyrase subunit A [Aquella oligotrophica]|uniref:DNA gyrase subunit A n=1 Tax=Aquella oligotrophica TaxID=2067065 RepID=A0A2I7N3X3_9NEIS|nr:DNA gyrase subunit A [Aquella oligotrophica]AUR51166.1 DNA gyrase subunit A [Aquella oligotrophica]
MSNDQSPLINSFAREVVNINIEEEMKQSYIEYAMSVIVGRALPDVRDGLKPVHRRVLYAMHELSNDWNKPYKKSARIVGDVIGKYHPHGDTAVYDTIVRMAQPFSLRYMLVDGQGNFGSVDGDSPAAMRYTEIRMSKIAHEMLADIDKETVNFGPNYDGSESEPQVMPTRIPNLLINGTTGIAVGMATNIPPHNLTEIIDGALALLDNPEMTIDELIEIIPAPDFPTAGIIFGIKDIHQGYKTGRGRVIMRARTHFEDIAKDRQAIIIDELPYQVNKAKLCERIGELVKEKIVEGISEIRDESDKSGMRVVIELRRGENANVMLNNLYKLTQMQDSFGINMVALVNGQPRLLNLKSILEEFIYHRREVVTRRTLFELRKAKDRGHILEGLAVALANVDPMIEIIKTSQTPVEAKGRLMERSWESSLVVTMMSRVDSEYVRPDGVDKRFGLINGAYYLSEIQAQAILELRLQRLTGLEQEKITQEYHEIMDLIVDLIDILNKPERVNQIIATEMTNIKEQFGDKRRSEIEFDSADIDMEDLIKPRDMVVTLSKEGYVKTQSLDEYRTQKRGGRGKTAAATREDDYIQSLFIAHTHDYVLCFSTLGRMYWLKVYNLPEGSRTTRGKPIINLLPLQMDEKITNILPVKDFSEDKFVFMVTEQGVVKKVNLSEFSRPSSRGIIAIGLDDGDHVAGVELTDGKREIMIFSDGGKAVRFNEEEVRAMGRQARGVRGIKLGDDCRVVALLTTDDVNDNVLTATENGYGKRTTVAEYRLASRGTQGVKAIGESARNGKLVAAKLVADEDEIMLITTGGVLIRTKVDSIRETGRSAQGVKLIDLSDGEKLVDLEKVIETEVIDNDLAETE